ncbi:L-ascorbate oxidase homolog [Phragmites australis]|uniref:L-ascorbate oxidase homolog n=1 Tax=Phragmites australis TaxID=29695 RepID=UPI002D779812|nr:L-ascorbate oxidase homolog [Phragmites australis]
MGDRLRGSVPAFTPSPPLPPQRQAERRSRFIRSRLFHLKLSFFFSLSACIADLHPAFLCCTVQCNQSLYTRSSAVGNAKSSSSYKTPPPLSLCCTSLHSSHCSVSRSRDPPRLAAVPTMAPPSFSASVTAVTATVVLVLLVAASLAGADDPYRYFTWTVTYGPINPLGTTQQGILINGQFPGPRIDCVTNDNLIVNVINNLDEPFLITWNGIKQRKNSWQDGVAGTNCPIPPGANYTYKFQSKDQIGTFTYFPSLAMHRAAGGFGALNVYQRPAIPVPYPPPAGDFTLLVGDWYKAGHKQLRQTLDAGGAVLSPDGLLINGMQSATFVGDQGKTYLFRVSNVGLKTSINFRIQNHSLKLVEVEGTHPVQNVYDSLDVHVGQSVAFLVTLDKPPQDYAVVASTRFSPANLTVVGTLHYTGGSSRAPGPLPADPPGQFDWSMNQARSFRWNLTASAARPNPQGSFHYGTIPTSRTLVFANSAPVIAGRRRCAVNSVSFVTPDTPLKLADNFNIANVISWDSIAASPDGGAPRPGTPVVRLNLHEFVEVVFQNTENELQSWHLDGYDFWVVGYGTGQWTENQRQTYNLVDAQARHTVQVYPNGWSAILVSLDNQGMWNLRSASWDRQYLGQQLYLRVWTAEQSFANEYSIPTNAILCGRAVGLPH